METEEWKVFLTKLAIVILSSLLIAATVYGFVVR